MTQISGETNNLDLYSEARSWCGIPLTDTTTLALPDFIRSANFGLERVISLIIRSNPNFDDKNNTDFPIALTDLDINVDDYSDELNFLKKQMVRVKDSEGNWKTLIPVNRTELPDSVLNADAGEPKYYDKFANSTLIFPKPNYSSTDGFEVTYQRGSVKLAFDATTTEPGFDSDFHILIALYGALDYCEKNDLDKKAAKIKGKIGVPQLGRQPGYGLENELVERYTTKDISQKTTLSTTIENYGQE